ncbi:MAG TPA: NAD(P)/FAD-dependent oxidoreductase [Oceanospirillales bacterium]|nr:monooxygenase [Oceanospirillaceae bacterium]HBS42865.1 NAD(P)/FAD-dependent oxidoreductase [Oceanospirillales bacterium]|tara:strand:+ start:7617 stop:9074 length:1458 start_codon:yes stop_codon:yes gene_type:complete
MKKFNVAIIGSGFGGQCAAINLIKQGRTDFVILERRPFMGGTWCQNTYPGAAVDVQSPLYSISHEPYDWSQMFAGQDELHEYTEYVIEKYRLRDHTHTDCEVDKVEWQEDINRWHLHIKNGEVYEAQFVINASGPLSTPVIPPFKGVDTFKGVSFHTNNWDHNFDYKGKRVAVVGSGASAAQVIPTIAGDVKELHVFQRTPHWVMPRHDYQFKPWQRTLLRNKWAYKALRWAIYWGLETRVIGFKYSDFGLHKLAQEPAMRHIARQIKDPELRKKVTPDYTIGCKRIILSDTLYPAFCQDNVSLYTRDHAIAEITENSIITTQDEHIELDAIIYATGYDATDGVVSYPIVGKGGQSVADFWSDYPRAYLGTSMPGFPNLFLVVGPNTGIGHTSAIFIIESQMNYIMNSIKKVVSSCKDTIEVKASAEEKYTNHIHSEMNKTVWKRGGCNSWYQSKSGKVIAMFPGFSFAYNYLTRRFKKADHAIQ